jgi:hypothetical protein
VGSIETTVAGLSENRGPVTTRALIRTQMSTAASFVAPISPDADFDACIGGVV